MQIDDNVFIGWYTKQPPSLTVDKLAYSSQFEDFCVQVHKMDYSNSAPYSVPNNEFKQLVLERFLNLRKTSRLPRKRR